MRILFAGDWHAGKSFAVEAIERTAAAGIDRIAHVGDFGFWPRHYEGFAYLNAVSKAAVDAGVTVWFCDGNHEDHDRLPHETADEPVELQPGIVWVPRGVTVEWGGRRILFMGGAVSIDQQSRFPGRTWFPDETPSEAQWHRARKAENVDIVVAHDTVPGMPVQGVPALSIPWSIRRRAREHRERLAQVQASVEPALWVHGHWHQRKSARIGGTVFESLAHDRGPHPEAALVCDLDDLTTSPVPE